MIKQFVRQTFTLLTLNLPYVPAGTSCVIYTRAHGSPLVLRLPPDAVMALHLTQERFDVDIKPLPDQIDASTYMSTS